MPKYHRQNRHSLVVIAFFSLVVPCFAGLLPFPLSANQRGTVTCLENPSITYDIYLPSAYSTKGTPLPILYTLNAGGSGMVSTFKSSCSNLNIITVGILGSKNGAAWDQVLKEFHAVTLDIRQRVLFDPTAEFVGGFSGGGENSYVFSRFRAQHVSGVLAMGGWLGRTYGTYTTTDRIQSNLLIARITGNTDSGGNAYLYYDSVYLAPYSAVIKDWSFTGGHTIPPTAVLTESLSWLLSQRTPAGPTDQSDAMIKAADWRSRAASGDAEAVLRECVAALMAHPRTWSALEAQLVLDELLANNNLFRSLNVSDLAQGDLAFDLFYYYARGAATNGNKPRYYAALKALTGITNPSGDRGGDIYSLLRQSGYPVPQLQYSADTTQGQMSLWFNKDTPGLTYSLQSRTDLAQGAWQSAVASITDTSGKWSSVSSIPLGATRGFYRVTTTPKYATSPSWPPP